MEKEQLDIPPIAKQVIALLREKEGPGFRERVNATAGQLLQDSLDPMHVDENGLTAYLITTHLGNYLEPGVSNQLQGILRSSTSKSPLIRDVLLKASVLNQETRIFQHPEYPSRDYYFTVVLTGNTLADLILTLEAHRTAKIAKSNSTLREDPNYVFEPFTHPDNRSVGVWMSKQGEHFLPELIR